MRNLAGPPVQTPLLDAHGLVSLPWLMYFQRKPAFTDRWNPDAPTLPTAPDLTQATATIDSAWHELDLTGIVPTDATAVLIRAVLHNTAAAGLLMLRKKGNQSAVNLARVETTGAGLFASGDLWIPCEVSRLLPDQTPRMILEYYVLAAGVYDVLYLTVAGWTR